MERVGRNVAWVLVPPLVGAASWFVLYLWAPFVVVPVLLVLLCWRSFSPGLRQQVAPLVGILLGIAVMLVPFALPSSGSFYCC